MPPNGHALLSASSSDRWLHCPPSARLCESYADKGSDYAAEGTDAHALCEYKLRKALGMQAEDPTENLAWFNQEMDDCATGYAAYILELVEAAKETCVDPVVLIEQRVDFSRWVEQGFGTSDAILIADGTMHVIDYKHGLPEGNTYPTIEELLTHTSGYKGYYLESPMVSNFFNGRNDFYGVTKEMVSDKAGNLNMNKASYDFVYSNYGYAVLGLVLESVYETEYTSLLNDFAQNELCLTSTQISDKSGDLGKYWDWKEGDAYLSAGAVTSNIEDMLLYAQMQLEDNSYFSDCHNSLKSINASTEMYKTMGIHMDEIGMSWILDSKNNIIWHNGGTGNYNSYLGFNPETGTAVVVLSNLAPNYRVPATVLGVKLLLELDNEK